VDVPIQPPTPTHGLVRNDTHAAVGHGRITSTFGLRHKGWVTERLAEAGIESSVGSVGNSYDNALAEAINGLYKAEVIYKRRSWRSHSEAELATLEWVD
jgi:hypothetical protein